MLERWNALWYLFEVSISFNSLDEASWKYIFISFVVQNLLLEIFMSVISIESTRLCQRVAKKIQKLVENDNFFKCQVSTKTQENIIRIKMGRLDIWNRFFVLSTVLSNKLSCTQNEILDNTYYDSKFMVQLPKLKC